MDLIHAQIIETHLKAGDTVTHTRCMGVTEEHIFTGRDGPWLCGKPTRDTVRLGASKYPINDIAPANVTHINRVPVAEVPFFADGGGVMRVYLARSLERLVARLLVASDIRYEGEYPFVALRVDGFRIYFGDLTELGPWLRRGISGSGAPLQVPGNKEASTRLERLAYQVKCSQNPE